MNKNKLKSYAPAARRDFIQAVTDRAHFFGLDEKEIAPVEESGDVAIIGGRPFPRTVAAQRRKLADRVKREGFHQVMEAVAYTWFNRFLALRYMELHGYLQHGFRVLSNSGSSMVPEILEHATELDLPGLNRQKVVELRLDGSKDAELYRMLLVAQCNALHFAMPFLFEMIEDETELLLPDNLLHSDSLIRKLVTEIDEEDWQEVEIIGWLYQFYISEKKDQVIGKVVKSEDIPAATQLFTPNWIVKYMVQNSLGRKWLATYPDSPLRAKMEYYIEPAEQTDEVKAQLSAITPDSLDPEKLTLLDPAAGSGHILVEAYEIFKEIYLERGYSSRDFPRLILEKNLYGLDIDDRAAQMAGFALLMKARKDDRHILRSDNPIKLNVMAIQDSGNIAVQNAHWGEHVNVLRDLLDLFRNGKTFGSLIQVPEKLSLKLLAIETAVNQALIGGDLYASQAARELLPLAEQAKVLASTYDCVVANPPYMGAQYQNTNLKVFLRDKYSGFDKDIFSAFIIRNIAFANEFGKLGFMSPFVWMFISSYEQLRKYFIEKTTLSSLVQLEYSGFDGATVPVCTFVLSKECISKFAGSYIKLSEFRGADQQGPKTLEAITNPKCGWLHVAMQEDFKKIPGNPIAFWIPKRIRDLFTRFNPLSSTAKPLRGVETGDNGKFLKAWYEVDFQKVGIRCKAHAIPDGKKWFPYNKGGGFCKWYGFRWLVIDWENSGHNIKTQYFPKGSRLPWRAANSHKYFEDGITWGGITSAQVSFRFSDYGAVFDSNKGAMVFPSPSEVFSLLGFLNSSITATLLKVLNPTLSTQNDDVGNLPFDASAIAPVKNYVSQNVQTCIEITRKVQDEDELSWDFKTFPWLINCSSAKSRVQEIYEAWCKKQSELLSNLKRCEEDNNRFFIEAYDLKDELSHEVTEDQITLACADREADMKRLISYCIGCIMGRYSLDQPGLVYANGGNVGFEPAKYRIFSADDDGIVPVMDANWFPDDAASRFEEFLKVAWTQETLEENLKFVADSLSPKGGETPRETIRRYISTQFFKDHLQTYKRRPIYWLFSSGKQRAFECLVYLHRYNESTLSRMRNEYVTPLQGKFSAQADYLTNEVDAATSTAERNRLQKQLDTLRKKQVELAVFDDLLRHYADQRINLDLDDGVKVNYGKFGALLAEVKTVTGGGE